MTNPHDITWALSTAIKQGKLNEQERIIELLQTELGKYLIWVDDTPYIKGIDLEGFIALIRGENKTNLWTSRPLTEEDKEHYRLEGENK